MAKSKIKAIMEKIREVLKEENTHFSLQNLIFFMLRILILRLSPTNLNELFRNIWPILLTLLVPDL
jgi:translation initiation factor 2B subunit (eIF-2B alpha/beta/delta family)